MEPMSENRHRSLLGNTRARGGCAHVRGAKGGRRRKREYGGEEKRQRVLKPNTFRSPCGKKVEWERRKGREEVRRRNRKEEGGKRGRVLVKDIP